MSEENRKRFTNKSPNVDYEGQQELQSDNDIDAFYRYFQKRYQTALKNDPDGLLVSAMKFQGFDEDSIVLMPSTSEDSPTMKLIIDGYKPHQNNIFVPLGEPIAGGKFVALANTIEDEIIALPQNGLQLLEKYIGSLPSTIRRVPSIANVAGVLPYKESGMGRDTRFKDSPLYYNLYDYRTIPTKECIERCLIVREHIDDNLKDKRYSHFAVDTAPSNPWKLRLHRYALDYRRRVAALVREHICTPGVRVVGRHKKAPYGFKTDKSNDLIMPFDEITKDIPLSLIGELESRINMLREDFKSIAISFRELLPDLSSDESHRGEFMTHEDLREGPAKNEGIIASLHTRKY